VYSTRQTEIVFFDELSSDAAEEGAVSNSATARRYLSFISNHLKNKDSSFSRITPGITRRPKRLLEYDRQRVGGRVHAVVRPPAGRGEMTIT
jgi:hypothetical protein